MDGQMLDTVDAAHNACFCIVMHPYVTKLWMVQAMKKKIHVMGGKQCWHHNLRVHMRVNPLDPQVGRQLLYA